MNKKGVAVVFAVVLTILVIVVGIGIIWVLISQGEADRICADGEYELRIISTSGYPIYDADDEIVVVQVEGHSDGCYIEYIKVVINFENGSESSIVPAPEPGELKVYYFNVSESKFKYGSPDSVQVAPVLDSPNEPELSPPEDVNPGDIPEEDIPEEDLFDIGDDYIVAPTSGYGAGGYDTVGYGE